MTHTAATSSANPPGPDAVAVWAEPAQVDLATAIATLADVRYVAAGSPVRGQTGAVAQALGCPGHDDLRSLLATTDARAVLILSPGEFGAGVDSAELEALQAAAARGVRVAALEPIPATLFDRAGGAPSVPARPLVSFLPRIRAARPFREAEEVLGQFGTPRTLSVEVWNATGVASLGAALFAAMDLLGWLMGEPRQIDAVHLDAGGSPSRGPESLRGLHGDFSAVLRFDDARAATLTLSDRCGCWNRAVTLTSPRGRFRLLDDAFEWIGPDGERIDELRPAPERELQPGLSGPEMEGLRNAARAIAQAVAEMLRPSAVLPPEAASDAALVLCETALLSARTAQPESPESIRRMLSTV